MILIHEYIDFPNCKYLGFIQKWDEDIIINATSFNEDYRMHYILKQKEIDEFVGKNYKKMLNPGIKIGSKGVENLRL